MNKPINLGNKLKEQDWDIIYPQLIDKLHGHISQDIYDTVREEIEGVVSDLLDKDTLEQLKKDVK